MKATGIIRRVDDLGRIVIPKEIRRSLRVREGDPMEIFLNGDEVIFRKYTPIDEISPIVKKYVSSIEKYTGINTIVTNRDCVSYYGSFKKVANAGISSHLDMLFEHKEGYIKTDETKKLYPFVDIDEEAFAMFPIISEGEVYGGIMFLVGNEKISADMIKVLRIAADFIGKSIE